MSLIVQEYLKPVETSRVLDVGCGNADMARLLPSGVTYVGLDNNSGYIAKAKAGGINVIEAHVNELGGLGYEPFDIAVAVGVLHHLDDSTVSALMTDVAGVLRPGGIFVTVDPVLHVGQSTISRGIMALDRGRFIRQGEAYSKLMSAVFPSFKVQMRFDLNPFPYAHCIMTASFPG
jgi:SAM-dependent methyltransferase